MGALPQDMEPAHRKGADSYDRIEHALHRIAYALDRERHAREDLVRAAREREGDLTALAANVDALRARVRDVLEQTRDEGDA